MTNFVFAIGDLEVVCGSQVFLLFLFCHWFYQHSGMDIQVRMVSEVRDLYLMGAAAIVAIRHSLHCFARPWLQSKEICLLSFVFVSLALVFEAICCHIRFVTLTGGKGGRACHPDDCKHMQLFSHWWPGLLTNLYAFCTLDRPLPPWPPQVARHGGDTAVSVVHVGPVLPAECR